MQLFQVTQPGPFVSDEQGQRDFEVEKLLILLSGSYCDGYWALYWFEKAVTEWLAFNAEHHGKSIPPQTLHSSVSRKPYAHAYSFLYALDTIQMVLDILSERMNAPSQLLGLKLDLEKAFPKLRDIRNSAHHMEDRIRGLKTGNRPIALQEDSAGNKSLILNSLNITGRKYGTTLADGTFGELEITVDKMAEIQRICQAIFNSYTYLHKSPSQVIY